MLRITAVAVAATFDAASSLFRALANLSWRPGFWPPSPAKRYSKRFYNSRRSHLKLATSKRSPRFGRKTERNHKKARRSV